MGRVRRQVLAGLLDDLARAGDTVLRRLEQAGLEHRRVLDGVLVD